MSISKKRTVEYLIYILTDQGITPSERHVEAVKKFLLPKNIYELQKFLGLVSFFRRFVPRFAEIAKSFYSLLKKSVAFEFKEQCITAFEKLKSSLVTFPVLQLYDLRRETELHTDASSIALAAILLHSKIRGCGRQLLITVKQRMPQKAITIRLNSKC